jgi:hypothetical protein
VLGRLFRVAAMATGVVLVGATAVGVRAQQAPQPATPPQASETSTPERFNGVWDYNDAESINAGTGRREQTPESATARQAANATRGTGARRGAAARGGGPDGFENVTGIYRGAPTVTANLIRRAENFIRDLLEIPEALTILVDDDAVVFTDDLARRRTYPTDGKQHDYLISASKYGASAVWDDQQLKRELAGGGGYKIFETYFLSEDGDRMFVIIRVKAPGRAQFIAGFNRVYDRIQATATGAHAAR